LPGANAGFLAVLVHIETEAGLPPHWLRRLAVLGGNDATDRLRLSKAEAAQLAKMVAGAQSDVGPAELGYRHGGQLATDTLAVRAAFAGQTIGPEVIVSAHAAATQTCPVTAADLIPSLQGAALGAALREVEALWIGSGFRLTRPELLAEILSPGGDRTSSLR